MRGLRKIFAGFFVVLGSEAFEARAAGLVLRMIRLHGRDVLVRGIAAAAAAGCGPFGATSLSANAKCLVLPESLPDWVVAAAATTGLGG